MKYMGSKARIAKQIVPIIQDRIDSSGYSIYIEPFVGGANVIDKISCINRIGCDKNKYLIALFEKLKTDSNCLPSSVSREEYSRVRSNFDLYEDWYVGAVGFLASYNGRFFDGGYSGKVSTPEGIVRDYYDESKRNIERQIPYIENVRFKAVDYSLLNPMKSVVYCDPPYHNTKGYSNSDSFNHKKFWERVRVWSKDNIVMVSEEKAPEDFTCIWEQEVTRTIKLDKTKKSFERLFIFENILGR